MIYRGKKYKSSIALINKEQKYNIQEACKILKMTPSYQFDESVDVSISVKKPMQKYYISLPYGNGKNVRILLITESNDSDDELKKKYNIDYVGGRDIIDNIEKKSFDLNYNYIVTTPDMLICFKKVAKILGPKGLMPSSKDGTVGNDIGNMVDILKKGRTCLKSDKNGSINLSLGRKSFLHKHICENFLAILKAIIRFKPSSTKGYYVKNVKISTTMGPGIGVDFYGLR